MKDEARNETIRNHGWTKRRNLNSGRSGCGLESGGELWHSGRIMGLAFSNITLENPKEPRLKPLMVKALADSAAVFLCVPAAVAEELQLEELDKKEITTANGQRQMCPYVGPVHIRFENRNCYTGAVVLGDEVLLGAIPMEDMDLVVLPKERRIAVNPLHPKYAAGIAKGFQHPRVKKVTRRTKA